MISALSRKRAGTPAPLSPVRFLFFILLLSTVALLSGCPERKEEVKSDLVAAQEAVRRRDTGDAEMYFQRYLRKNPNGDQRREVWEELLKITLSERQDKQTAADYLELMLMEFEDQPERRRGIQLRLAEISNELLRYDRAQALWEAAAGDPQTPAAVKAGVLRNLSRVYLLRLEFMAAVESLETCLHLDVPAADKGECSYSLAETQMLTGELDASTATLRELLKNPEISPERRVLTVFMLADVSEMQGRMDEAARLFESIRGEYPNEKVVEMRITTLKQKKKPLPTR